MDLLGFRTCKLVILGGLEIVVGSSERRPRTIDFIIMQITKSSYIYSPFSSYVVTRNVQNSSDHSNTSLRYIFFSERNANSATLNNWIGSCGIMFENIYVTDTDDVLTSTVRAYELCQSQSLLSWSHNSDHKGLAVWMRDRNASGLFWIMFHSKN